VSERLHRLGAIIRADFLIRLRRPSTAIVFLLLSAVPYLWIPAPSTGRALMVIEGKRAIYNSAAIGMSTAVIGTLFLGLFGFYVISNALRRDVLTRCGYVIASTTIRGGEYILGKFAGNLAFLTVFTLGFMATSMAMVLVRGEAPLEPLVFAKQYLLLLPPALVFVSATSIVFECTPLLRTKFGDILYFFLYISLMTAVGVLSEKGVGGGLPAYFDISGFGLMLQQLKALYHTNSLSIGASSFDASKGLIEFHGLRGSGPWLLPRIVSTLWPMSLLLIGRLFFHRFDPARVRALPNEKARRSWIGRLNMLSKPLARLFVRAGQLVASVPGTPALVRSMMTDALATIGAFPLAAVAVIVVGITALAADATTLFTGTLPFAFAVSAIAISDIASREKRSGTSALVYAAPALRSHFVSWKFGATLLVAAAFLGLPVAKAIALKPSATLPLLVGVAFMTAAATALGIISSNPKTFIVCFLSFAYVAVGDKGQSPALDFAGLFGKATPAVVAAYAGITIAFLAAAQLFHANQLKRKW